jgi:hypothetical protein
MQSPDLSDLLVRIQVNRQNLRHYYPDIDALLIQWGISVLAPLHGKERLLCLLENRSEHSQWWLIRQLLPDEVLPSLDEELSNKIKDFHGTDPTKLI